MNCERNKLWLFIWKTTDNTYLFLEEAFKYEDWMKWLTYAEFELLTEEQLEDRFDNYDWEDFWIEAVRAKQTTEWLDDWVDSVRAYDWLTSVIDTSYCCDIEDELWQINEKEWTDYEYSNCIGWWRFGNSYNNDKLNRDNYEYVNEENFKELLRLYKEYEEDEKKD